ncbi:MAG: hypothetical protein IT428_26405 [Planctomycetaceae bacterium]|nr:hypothetical protein [Planctomycetaceae bacterium]
MPETSYDRLASLKQSSGKASVVDHLVETFRREKNHHKLFDTLLLRKKLEMGLPLIRPTSLEDVPADRRDEFETAYIEAAREVGKLFLADGNIGEAWLYLKTIREPQPVKDAISAITLPRDADKVTDEVIQIAVHEGANPVKGIELMLRHYGTCNTVTTLDQIAHTLPAADRPKAAAVMVQHLYNDLCYTVRSEVQKRIPMLPPNETLRSLIAGRDWLFGEGNYHIDVSHLHAVVRFARFLEPGAPELKLAIQLAEYGSKLSPQFQYGGDPPFEDYYPAHIQFFKALLGENADEALGYFRNKLEQEPDEQDKPMLAYVLTDLLVRTGRKAEAVELAAKYLSTVDESTGFSFTRLCVESNRLDLLRDSARDRGDLVGYAAALLQQS